MEIVVKNLKIARSLSEETTAYTADIYVDGIKSFAASNHGHGGCDFYHRLPVAKVTEADVNTWLATNVAPAPRASFWATAGKAVLRYLGSTAWSAMGWLIPMLATAAFTAYVSYIYNQKANTLLIIQQQKVADLQQFKASGSLLDAALGKMSDALVDGKGLEPARREMRDAITRSIGDAGAVRGILDPAGTDKYIEGLANLRDIVDNVDTVESGQQLWQGSLNLMESRKRLVQDAERRIYAG